MTEARAVYTAGGGLPHTARHLAIVGSHPAGLETVPWDDDTVEIWCFNEAPLNSKFKRWDALLQLHAREVYASKTNWVNPDYWPWLQQDHKRPIFMQAHDQDVPNSIAYPLDEVLAMIPYKYLRSSPAMALALAVYLGYETISLYGMELSSNTEYAYQAVNFAFWLGFAHGKGIDLRLMCWQSEFSQRIYGYDGELQIDADYYKAQLADINQVIFANRNTPGQLDRVFEQAIARGDVERAADLASQMDSFYLNAGTADAKKGELVRYIERGDMISRQEYERCTAQAQQDGEKARTRRDHLNGIVEYTWNAWKSSGSADAAAALRHFLKQRNEAAYNLGMQHGKYTINLGCMIEYDKRIAAAGGVRALGRET